MKLARVIGHVVSTIKEASYQDWKLLVVEPMDLAGVPSEDSYLAVDLCQAGIGDHVLVLHEGNSIRALTGNKKGAVDAVAVGVIDHVQSAGRQFRPGEASEG